MNIVMSSWPRHWPVRFSTETYNYEITVMIEDVELSLSLQKI